MSYISDAMDMPWGSGVSKKFVANLGLITTKGPLGDNVMTAEWSRHVSYSPGLVMVNLNYSNTTTENIISSKEFGLGLASDRQVGLISAAGSSHGKDVDKVGLLRELGAEFYPGKKVDLLMIKGTTLNMECKLLKYERLGDHMMIVGEVVHMEETADNPIVMHGGALYKLDNPLEGRSKETMEKLALLIEKYARKK